uniref:Guanidinoacetate N-methyltransferase n=1 Tax=Candidatus Kentrum sp. FM TaxID=2126340 RepID=A0A450X4A8_9GAMM|nr:MAG: guanidinoacetate N-methyltransferase [Candidatus Kentron sp. FM]VFJ69909.1 MAG: guanidinoacetate N-methyltransferase [Candidatus Kentron sp. FM]VFK24126.1 MAG: guanidinoacetate N-methyltransferase [Candidatus Kentron sp. FM]
MNKVDSNIVKDKKIATIRKQLEEKPVESEKWPNAPVIYNDEQLLINNEPVMERWETPYMASLAKVAASNGGVVLEVGFGMAISATFIQDYPIQRHIIIEGNETVFGHLKEFAKTAKRRVEPMLGLWQNVISSIPDNSLDGILFDTYPFSGEDLDITFAVPFFSEAHRLLKRGGVFTYFSCEIDDYSPEHLQLLQDAGFKDIQKEVIPVSPPKDCVYWENDTMMTPIVRK